MSTYALGIQETDADNNLWLKVEGPDNETVFTVFAESLRRQVQYGFSVADVIADIKKDLTLLGIHIDNTPNVDHTPHLFIESDNAVALFDKESGDHLVTKGIAKWASTYSVDVRMPEDGIGVY